MEVDRGRVVMEVRGINLGPERRARATEERSRDILFCRWVTIGIEGSVR